MPIFQIVIQYLVQQPKCFLFEIPYPRSRHRSETRYAMQSICYFWETIRFQMLRIFCYAEVCVTREIIYSFYIRKK